MDVIELRRLRKEKVEAAEELTKGELTDEVRAQFDAAMDEVKQLDADIERAEKLNSARARSVHQMEGPAVIGRRTPDKAESIFLRYLRSDNDPGARAELRSATLEEQRASNNTDMNIGTAADGGDLVPTGHYNGIIAKRDATMLAPKLGVMNIPGKGTTVNVPFDNGTANAFVSTAEATNFDRDAPVIGKKAFTLVKYTKKIELSYELLQDEDSRVMAFLNDYVGRALALTHNTLLITEALSAGTSVALAAVTAASAGDPQTLAYTLKQAYADGAQFVMKGATYAALMKLTGNAFQYAQTPGGARGYELWGYPVQRDENLEAIASGKKTMLFGNFNYMGLYEAPSMTFLYDPYSSSDTGQVVLRYYFRADYGVLLPEAILYGQHPTA